MTAIELLEEIRRLMQLKGENPFKVRAFEKAEQALAGRTDLEQRARAGTLVEIPGIGKGISEVLTGFLVHGVTPVLEELRGTFPPGFLELTAISGLGPKKAQLLIDVLGIKSVAELEYACRENRLLQVKGFGEKAQKKILDGIEFYKTTRGKLLWADTEGFVQELLALLKVAVQGVDPKLRLSETGALRRRLEILEQLDFLIELPAHKMTDFKEKVQREIQNFCELRGSVLPVRLHFSETERFGYELTRTTATSESWQALCAVEGRQNSEKIAVLARDEKQFFASLNLPEIPPETLETGEEVTLARAGALAKILPWVGIQGVFHNHTIASDGAATLEQMVQEARRLRLQYIGISDHSQSAFYAQGLKLEALNAQERELRRVQEKYPDIRIFWGIESDILADGSLDYDSKTLRRFDFVIGSIHSRFQMDREEMTQRVIQAVRNPHLHFIGHLTGRILLGRDAYALDVERVIEEASRQGVAIEINAHPSRLDIDWRWGKQLRKHGTLVCINPDAHQVSGIADFRHGIAVARKAILPAGQVLNTRSVAEVEKWLKAGKS